MSTEFSEILDSALEQLQKKDSIPAILENYPSETEYLAPLLYTAEALNATAPVELPPDEVLQMDRVEFLASITRIEIPSVSLSFLARIKEQMTLFIRNFKFGRSRLQKEKRKMNMLFARAILVSALFFGITGGGYALTEGSVPDSPLYEAKLAMEQAQLQMKSDSVGVAGQHLIMARHRIQEIIQLAQSGKMPDEGVMTKLENHLNTAFQLAAQLGDNGEMLGVLTQAKIMLQEQIQQMIQIQAHASDPIQAQLQLVFQLLTQAQNQAELGLQNPDAFRLQFRNGSPSEQPVPGGPNGEQDCPNCPCVDCGGNQDQDQTRDQVRDQAQDQGQDRDQDQIRDQDQDQDQDRDQDQILDQDQDQDQGQDRDQDRDQDQDQSCDGTQPNQPGVGEPNGDQNCPNCPCVDCNGK